MCGIAGLFDPTSTPSEELLAEMNACHVHRGPNESGVFRTGPVGLAHQRLSIIDLDTGRQPIFNEDESVVVIFNGEIYNYRRLREKLESQGHTFTTDTDTEVLVHLYEEHGPSFVDRLQGMFAFALWDDTTERLVLARDPMGIKPMILAQDGDRLGFASEIPALLASEVDHGGLDRTAIAQYFAFGFVPAPRTAFENLRKLRPGERAVVTEEGIDRERYYVPSAREATPTPSFANAAARLRSRVEAAVEKRLMADVPLGAFLSGGIDSTIVVGTMAQLVDDPVQTFTIGFDQALFDESWAAREVASYHGTDHHETTIDADDVRELIPTVLDRLGEPFADQSLLPSYVVSRETSNDVTVALSGDGADELFAGYDKYRVEWLSEYYRALPKALRERAIKPAVNALPASRGSKLGTTAYRGQWFVNRSGNPSVPERHFELMRLPSEDATDAFADVDPITTGREALAREHAELEPDVRSRDSLARIQTVDTRYSLPHQMLQKVDTASMYNSLEVRVPFLDVDVVEHALGLPTGYKITRSERKRVLKHAFEDLFPPAILERNKQGFDMPIGEWFKNELAEEFRRTVRSVDVGVLDDDAVLRIHREHADGRRNHEKFLWSVYVFKRWAERMRQEGFLDERRG